MVDPFDHRLRIRRLIDDTIARLRHECGHLGRQSLRERRSGQGKDQE
ncbi:hypothetical protein [Sphingomonas sp.]|nr:hypothetical protein [Sphingomonas sp.]